MAVIFYITSNQLVISHWVLSVFLLFNYQLLIFHPERSRRANYQEYKAKINVTMFHRYFKTLYQQQLDNGLTASLQDEWLHPEGFLSHFL